MMESAEHRPHFTHTVETVVSSMLSESGGGRGAHGACIWHLDHHRTLHAGRNKPSLIKCAIPQIRYIIVPNRNHYRYSISSVPSSKRALRDDDIPNLLASAVRGDDAEKQIGRAHYGRLTSAVSLVLSMSWTKAIVKDVYRWLLESGCPSSRPTWRWNLEGRNRCDDGQVDHADCGRQSLGWDSEWG